MNEFISAAEVFRSAVGYYDGICAYLYGVLAKERAPDSSLAYEEYRAKFNTAAEELAAYERPLAQTIGGLVEFHFNHFLESARLSPDSRVGIVAARYATWIEDRREIPEVGSMTRPASHLEALVTDWDTEQIVRWAIRALPDLPKDADEIESFLSRNSVEYDAVKLHILLGELYVASGNLVRALGHARALRNIPTLEKWAEDLIRAISEDHYDV